MPNQLFGGPFALVVTRDRIGPGAQRAHVDKSPDACLPRSGEHVSRAPRVHVLEGALANFADYPYQMDDRIHPSHCPVQRGRRQHIAGMNVGSPA